jgi:hypothetical protein
LGSKYDQRIDADTRARQYRRQGGTNFSCRGLVLPSSSSSSSEIKTVYCERRWNTILVLDLAGESTPPPGPHPNVPSFPPPLLLLRCYASFTCCARKILAKQWANLAVGLDLESLHKTELTADNVLASAFDLAIQKRLEQKSSPSPITWPELSRRHAESRIPVEDGDDIVEAILISPEIVPFTAQGVLGAQISKGLLQLGGHFPSMSSTMYMPPGASEAAKASRCATWCSKVCG